MLPISHDRATVLRPKAFTLVELLVVIAVVALMVAILLPSLARAREVAQRAICLNRIRQSGMSMVMYSNDDKDILPDGYYSDGNFNNSFVILQWDQLVDSYTSGDARAWVCPEWKRFGGAPVTTADFRSAASLGGGYAHRIPNIYSSPDPTLNGQLICENDPQFDVFKAHLPNTGWPHYVLTAPDALNSAPGRYVLRSEQCIGNDLTYGPGLGWFGDVKHVGGDGLTPEGGNVLWTDLSACWSNNEAPWPGGPLYWVTLAPK